jgi:hypothetical protein
MMKKLSLLLTCLLALVTVSAHRAILYAAPPQAPASARAARSPRAGHHGNAGEFLPAELTKSSGCKADGANPDPACTPGAVMGISVDVVCNTSTKGRRAVTTQMKDQVYGDYGITSHPTGEFEVDHFIPLELGGSNVLQRESQEVS